VKDQRRAADEGPPKVPGYIVTYSDMVTLLLTFFVMLMSLASVQDPELFNRGRGAFVESVRALGLGMLQGQKPSPDFGNKKPKYFISQPDELYGRTVDAKEEEIRRLFNKVNRLMTTMPSQIVAQRTDFSVANIRFSQGDAVLGELPKKSLAEFCANLQESSDSVVDTDTGGGAPPHENAAGTLYVLGLAGDQKTEKQQWILSAQRARAVADFLQATLSVGPPSQEPDGRPGSAPAWRIFWWGAGPGGDWVGRDSPISKQSQVLIAVLKAGG
jgi:flagellar motor protein MotB